MVLRVIIICHVDNFSHTETDDNLGASLQESHFHVDRIDIRSFVIIRFSKTSCILLLAADSPLYTIYV
jgi:hypothetical protein